MSIHSKKSFKTLYLLSCRSLGNAGTSSTKPERETFRDRLWSFSACVKEEGLELRTVAYFQEIQNLPTTMVTANAEVQTNEEAQVNVHDLDIFVAVQLLEDALAVLSVGKLCKEHGYSHV